MEEEDEIQAQACKFPRFENGGRNDHSPNNNNKKIAPRGYILHNEDVENIGTRRGGGGGISDGGGITTPSTTTNNRLHSWHHSSRIIRVSRASGGKDRHSKVMTSKGLRDRRVRLSVTTAIQFYDLQDRLGYDQPSKAVEWLIKSAADAISELPSLDAFPDTPKQLSDEKRVDLGLAEQGFADDSGEAELDHGDEGNYNDNQQQQQKQNQSQNLSLSKSACSSTSETSKGSGLSLSRSDIRVKARERARERAAKEKKKDYSNNNDESLHHQINAHSHHQHHQNMNPISQTASFTELLTGGINNAVPVINSPTGSVHQNHGSDEPNNLFSKASRQQQQQQQWGSTPMSMDYFSPVFVGASSSSRTQQHHQSPSEFSASQIRLGHSLAEAMSFNVVSGGGDQNQNQNHHHSTTDQLQQHLSFIHDHLMPSVVTSSQQQPSGNNNTHDYNLNFTMLSSSSSMGLAGYNNRGTLQSNSSHPSNNLLPHQHLQRFSVPTMDGSTVPFFFGAAAAPVASAAATAMENHHHHQHQLFSPAFDGRLQLCYGGDGSRHSDQKGKTKN